MVLDPAAIVVDCPGCGKAIQVRVTAELVNADSRPGTMRFATALIRITNVVADPPHLCPTPEPVVPMMAA